MCPRTGRSAGRVCCRNGAEEERHEGQRQNEVLVSKTWNSSLWYRPSVGSYAGCSSESFWSPPRDSWRCSGSPVVWLLLSAECFCGDTFNLKWFNYATSWFVLRTRDWYSRHGDGGHDGGQLGGDPALHHHHGLFHLHLVVEGDELRLGGALACDQPPLHVGLVEAVQPECSRDNNR